MTMIVDEDPAAAGEWLSLCFTDDLVSFDLDFEVFICAMWLN